MIIKTQASPTAREQRLMVALSLSFRKLRMDVLKRFFSIGVIYYMMEGRDFLNYIINIRIH